jgi:hypothetical protein
VKRYVGNPVFFKRTTFTVYMVHVLNTFLETTKSFKKISTQISLLTCSITIYILSLHQNIILQSWTGLYYTTISKSITSKPTHIMSNILTNDNVCDSFAKTRTNSKAMCTHTSCNYKTF